jgi:hypothetical protein
MDKDTSNFIYDALRVVVGIAIIVLITYLACNVDIHWRWPVFCVLAFLLGYAASLIKHTRIIQRIKDTHYYVKHRGCSYSTAWKWAADTL